MRITKDNKALVFELLIAAAMAVVIFFALMNIGTFINGTISQNLLDTYPTNVSLRTDMQNMSINVLENISTGYDDNVDIMIVAALITVITIPLAAVVAIKKLM